jgi:hypothetical protein
MRQECTRDVEWTEQVDGKVPPDGVGLAEIVEVGDAGIVDEDVDGAVFGRHLRWKRGDRGTVGDIETMPADADLVLGVPFACNPGGGVRERCIVDVGEGEMAAATRERHGDSASDSAGRSGDDGRAALEIHHGKGTSRRSSTS